MIQPPAPLPPTMTRALLIDDSWPWYDAPADYAESVARIFGRHGFDVLSRDDVETHTLRLCRRFMRAGDLVVLPLMGSALMLPAARAVADEIGARVVAVPLSRHPFVTLSAGTADELDRACATYAESSRQFVDTFWTDLKASGERHRRVVYFDTNSATGKDFLLFDQLLRRWAGFDGPTAFVVLVNETAEDFDHGPGHRGGKKVLSPQDYAIRLIGTNTRYVSHFRFLRMDADQQRAQVRELRARHPDMTAFWEVTPADLGAIHGYRTSQQLIHRERLHIRYNAHDVDNADELRHALAELDATAPLRLTPTVAALRRDLLTYHRAPVLADRVR